VAIQPEHWDGQGGRVAAQSLGYVPTQPLPGQVTAQPPGHLPTQPPPGQVTAQPTSGQVTAQPPGYLPTQPLPGQVTAQPPGYLPTQPLPGQVTAQPPGYVPGQPPSPAQKPGARRRRPPALAVVVALIGLIGLAATGIGISRQVMPRTFTPAQRRQIEAWEIARRWRVLPKTAIFPLRIHYQLPGGQLGSDGALTLIARRLEIARQTSCARGAGPGRALLLMLDRHGCEALLRATYTDASSSLVLTVGIAVLANDSDATTAATYLTRESAGGQGAVTARPLLSPVSVSGSPAAVFDTGQRQLSWAVSAGPYLVVTTVGYADGRRRVPVRADNYTYLEMTSLAHGVASAVARPLGSPPPIPRCPGGPAC
jgi:hypothetical protein